MSELQTLWLPLSITALAVAVLLVDVMSPPSAAPRSGKLIGWFVAAALTALFIATFFVPSKGDAAHSVYHAGPWSTAFQRLFLIAGVLGALGGVDHIAKLTPRRQGEHWFLYIISLLGMVVLPAARDLLLIVVAFETMGIPLYILAAYAKTDPAPGSTQKQTRPSEAGLKLYLVGATSSAVTLFGLAMVTGLGGSTRLDVLSTTPASPLFAVGLAFVLGGLGYKLGMAPFHMWVPDTYQGAPTPFVAFLSVAPKAAGLAVLAVLCVYALGGREGLWVPGISMVALLSMGIGNVLALPQTDLRRLMGYSGIAQMGYVLLALAAHSAYGLGMMLFFLTAYIFTNMGLFFILHTSAEESGTHDLDNVAGLAQRSPGLAAALLCFLLSLAGIPFVVGFWAKLYVLLAAWRAGMIGLVVAGIVLAVMGLFYYLRVLKSAYMVEPGDLKKPTPGPGLGLAVAICTLAVVVLGLWPGPLVEGSMNAAKDLLRNAPTAAFDASIR